MVVLVVVGLLISLVGMNIGGGGERRELTEVSRTLYLRMQAAADEAVLTSREIGIRFGEDNRYRFLSFDRDEAEWVPESRGGLPGGRLPEWAEIEIQSEGDSGGGTGLGDSDAELIPHIVFFRVAKSPRLSFPSGGGSSRTQPTASRATALMARIGQNPVTSRKEGISDHEAAREQGSRLYAD